MERGRREIDLLFPLCGFFVFGLDYLCASGGNVAHSCPLFFPWFTLFSFFFFF